MPLMQWNEHFATGVDIIDEQHRWLIDLVNAAAPALALNYEGQNQHIDELLDQLMSYAGLHFRTEDRLMRAYGIDARHEAAHRLSHASFASEVKRMRDRYKAGDTPSGSRLLTFLANWLIYHILGEDQALARQMFAIDKGQSPTAAFESVKGDCCEPTHQALTQALIDAYTLMTVQNRNLAENNQELERNRQQLEERVAARTADLARALDAAETSNRARSSFIANMSHEIRTPMNVIVGVAWSLRQGTSDPAQLARIDRIGEAAKQLLAIINSLLDMARIESEQMTLSPLDFDPARVLHEVIAPIVEHGTAKGLSVKLDADGLPPLLRGDPVLLGQILGNYAENALKFTEAGSITLRARRLPDEGEQIRLRFEVEDTGIGIPADTLPRLFQPFEQADTSSTRRHGGTGLGLAISRRLAAMMGGRTGVDSTPGKGSLFWAELPFAAVALSGAAQSAPGGVAPAASQPPAEARAVSDSDREILQRVAALLADDDVRAITLWRESASRLSGVLGRQLNPLMTALAAYDFATAHALLREQVGDAIDGAESDGTSDRTEEAASRNAG